MKRFLILALFLSTAFSTFSQNILFDNTKSEQAGNADWIPDTDSRYPSPAQSGISGTPLPTTTGTAETYWSGALSYWAVEMVKRGYNIETLPSSGSITYGDGGNAQDLSNYDVFVVCEPNNPFSAAEKTALLNFVQNGGGLFMIADHPIADRDGDGWSAPGIWNDFLSTVPGNGFGMSFDLVDDYTNAPTINIPNLPGDPLLHGVAGDVAGIEFHGGATMFINTTDNATVKAVVYRTGVSVSGTSGIICAYSEYGSGRIVGMGDSSIPEDVTPNSGTTYDGFIQPIGGAYDGHNGRLVSNATIWLMGAGPTGPTMTVTPSSISSYTYVEGSGPSPSQSFLLAGTALDGTQVTVTAPTNYEVSLDNSIFSASVIVPYTAPTLSNTAIYVRLKAGLLAGTYNNENVTSTDNGTATAKTIINNGTVTSPGLTTTCEDFNTGLAAAYTTGTQTLSSGDWYTVSVFAESAADSRGGIGSAARINDDTGGACLTTPALNTVGNVTFWYRELNSGGGTFILQKSYDGAAWTDVTSQAFSGLTYTEFTFDVNDASNPVYIRVLNDNNPGHLIIDDFCWTNYSVGCSAPTTQASNVTFSSITSSSMTVNWTRGATPGDGVIVLAHEAAPVDADPVDGSTYTANSFFGNGSEIGTGNFVVFMGSGTSVNVTGLSSSTRYYFQVYEYNCTGASSVFNTATPAAGDEITITPPVITITGTLSNFGTECVGSSTAEQSYSVSGTNLTGDITVTAPFGFQISTTSGGPYSASVVLPQVGGIVASTTIYVVFSPLTFNTYIETIAHSSPGAVLQEQACAGNGVDIPDLTTTAVSAITGTTASSGGTISADNGSAVTVRGVCWNTATNPTTANFTTSDGTGTGAYVSSMTGLTPGTTYYVRAYATNACGTAYGNELSFSTLKGEPTNNATAFTCGSSTSSSIQFTWTDAAGGVEPDGYLILCNTTGTFTDPVDGTAQADVAGSVLNVSQGVQTATFTTLASSTTYYFKVYPYSNSGTDIDYKIDGTVLTGTCNTASAPSVFISEFCGLGFGGAWQDEYIEISNNSGSDADLTGWHLEYYNSTDVLEGDVVLSGTLVAGDAWVIAARSSGWIAITPDFNGNFAMNSTGYAVLKDASLVVYDEAGATADKFADGENFEFTDCGNDNKPTANWVDLNGANGTPGVVNCVSTTDSDSEVDGEALGVQPNPGTIASTVDTDPEAIRVFDFTIVDKGTSDGVVTDVTQITIVPGTNNTADWSVVLQGAKLSLDNGATFITTGAPVITTGSIVFPITAGNLQIADGGSSTVQLFTYLNTTGITDNEVLEFKVDGNSHGFTADAAGSQFATTFTGTVPSPVSNQIIITVTATQLLFVQQPTNTVVNNTMSPNPTVKACDVNGNIDVDYTSTISVSSDGTMTGDPVSGTWSSGVATFASLVHTVIEAGRTLTVTDSGLASITSNLFDITDIPTNCASELIISEVDENGADKYIEIYNNTGAPVSLLDYDLAFYTNGSAVVSYSINLDDAGTIADQDVWVLGATAIAGVTDQTSASLAINGDDAIALRKSSVNIDVVGVIGTQVAWYENKTLTRNSNVYAPTTTYDAAEWSSVAYAGGTPPTLGSHSMICTCEEPTVQASNLTFTNISDVTMDLSWTSGDGLNRIVVAKEGSPVDWTPTDGNTYAANSSFASGTELGIGNYVVYNGSGTGVTVTNLTPGTTYYFTIFEYGCNPGAEDYLTTGTPEEGNETTLPNNVSNLTVVCSTASSMEVSWTLPSGNYDAVLITVLEAGTPHQPTCAGSSLTNPITDYSTANNYCDVSTAAVYVFNNIGTSVSITGLTSGQSYTIKAFTYSGNSWSVGTSTTHSAEVSDVMNLQASCGNATSQIGWSNPNAACFDEILIVASDASVVATPSGDGSAYTADPIYGNGTDIGTNEFVVYKGTGELVDVTSLLNNTTYYFKAFVRSGTDWSVGVEVSCMPSTAVLLNYGDLAIVGINTDITGLAQKPDEIQIVCFVNVTTNTAIDFTDNGYERLTAGLWGDSEGTLRFTRTGADLPAGTVITIQGMSSTATPVLGTDYNVFVCGADDNANWSVSSLNAAGPYDLNVNDQIWMMQGGTWNNGGVNGDHDATYSGNVLYGWTATGWKPAPGYDDTKGSTIYPGAECATTDVAGKTYPDKVRYTGPTGITSQIGWIGRFNDPGNWTDYADNPTYFAGGSLPCVIPINYDVATTKWTGVSSTDWDNCANWNILRVPDASTDVEFENDNCLNDIVIKTGETATCNNLTINGTAPTYFIKLEGDNTKVLDIKGDLTINAEALDLDDGNNAISDGVIIIEGDWINNLGTVGFVEGNSTIEFNGTVSQSITTVDTEETFAGLTINNNSVSGVLLNNNIVTNENLLLNSGLLSLNGSNLTINGQYSRNSGFFAGNAASFINVLNAGTLAPFYFASPQELNTFYMNRVGEISALATNLTMNDMTIDAGTIQLNSGKFFTVSNLITNNAGTDGLLIKSTATGTASLIHYTENVPATCERYMEGGKWGFLFMPLNNVNPSVFRNTPDGININFYWYNEPSADYWGATQLYSPTGWTYENTNPVRTSKGHILFYPQTRIYEIVGGNLYYNATTNNKTFDVTYTTSGAGTVYVPEPNADIAWTEFDGWNLLGNPYTAALDWNLITKNNIENYLYFYDGINYQCYGISPYDQGITLNGGSQFIPANQSFFVKADAPTGTLVIPDAARTHNSQAFWKGTNNIPDNILKLKIANIEFSDETVIRTLPLESQVTDEHDGSYDAYKMFAWDNEIPQVYTRTNSNSRYFAINSLPEIESYKTVPLGVYTGESGEYTFEVSENSFNNIHVYLEDVNLNIKVRLQNVNTYNFYQTAENNTNRFLIHFAKNYKPVVNFKIPKQTAYVSEDFIYTIPENLFYDSNEGDSLNLSVKLTNGQALPEWLIFNSESNTFTGIPDLVQTLNIRVYAYDSFNEFVYTDFVLDVKSNSSSVQNSDEGISIYPNPVKSILNIDINEPAEYIIYGIEGKIVKKGSLEKNNQLNVTEFPNGTYLIKIFNDKRIYSVRFIKI